MNLLHDLIRQSSSVMEDTPDRVRVEMFDRVYPLAGAPKRVPTIPLMFRTAAEDIVGMLPFAKLSAARLSSKDAMYRAFHESCEMLSRLHEEMAKFSGAIFRCNVEVRTDWTESRRKHELMQRKLKEFEKLAPKFKFQPPATIRLELDSKPAFMVRVAIEHAIRAAAEEFILATLDAFDWMVDMEQIGILRWVTDSSCRFSFFRHVVIEETTDTRLLQNNATRNRTETDGTVVRETKRQSRVERDLQHTHRHARHVHEVVEAKNRELPAKDVKKPERVRQLLDVFPAWLYPLGRIITGQEIHRTIIEQDLRTESTTEVELAAPEIQEVVLYRPDPAVCVGHYVLTGWGEEEVSR